MRQRTRACGSGRGWGGLYVWGWWRRWFKDQGLGPVPEEAGLVAGFIVIVRGERPAEKATGKNVITRAVGHKDYVQVDTADVDAIRQRGEIQEGAPLKWPKAKAPSTNNAMATVF